MRLAPGPPPIAYSWSSRSSSRVMGGEPSAAGAPAPREHHRAPTTAMVDDGRPGRVDLGGRDSMRKAKHALAAALVVAAVTALTVAATAPARTGTSSATIKAA